MCEARQHPFNSLIADRSNCAIIGRLSQVFWFAANASNNVNWTIHRPKMDAS